MSGEYCPLNAGSEAEIPASCHGCMFTGRLEASLDDPDKVQYYGLSQVSNIPGAVKDNLGNAIVVKDEVLREGEMRAINESEGVRPLYVRFPFRCVQTLKINY